jgi:SAM-dependent methyltransferase
MKFDQKRIAELLAPWGNCERQVEVPFLFDSLPEPPAKVLDVGCCYSSILDELGRLGFENWGLDMINCCAGFGRFVHGDARAMTFQDNEFDVATCMSTIEHIGLVRTPYNTDKIEDPDGDFKAMKEMIRVVKPGGLIILTIPYGKGSEQMQTWIKFYDKERVNKLIEGTEIVKELYSIRENDIWKTTTEEEASKPLSTKDVISNLSLLLKVK